MDELVIAEQKPVFIDIGPTLTSLKVRQQFVVNDHQLLLCVSTTKPAPSSPRVDMSDVGRGLTDHL